MRTQIAKKVNVVTGDRFAPEGALDRIDDKRPTITIGSSFVKPKKYINVYKQCSYPGCNKPAINFHHADRWSITKNHDNIRPLCKEHHEFPHNGLIENETSGDWQLNINGELKPDRRRCFEGPQVLYFCSKLPGGGARNAK